MLSIVCGICSEPIFEERKRAGSPSNQRTDGKSGKVIVFLFVSFQIGNFLHTQLHIQLSNMVANF